MQADIVDAIGQSQTNQLALYWINERKELILPRKLKPSEVLSYMEMCSTIGVNLQRGMNFRLKDGESIILMSLRKGAPYADRVEDEGRTLIYEGHDIARTTDTNPKKVDQPERNPGGSLTQNGLFAVAAQKYKEGVAQPERVRVFEKIRAGIWVYNGLFKLIDCWNEQSGGRNVFKFKLQLVGIADEGLPAVAPTDWKMIGSSQAG